MDELIQNLSLEERQKSLIFMDNLSAHCTSTIFQFYKNKKLKILFNAPYMSPFNMVELCFRQIKRETYKHLYSSVKELKENIIKIINEESFRKQLKSLFKETLNKYLKFINDYSF